MFSDCTIMANKIVRLTVEVATDSITLN